MGVATFQRLLQEHGSATAALAALPEIARASGLQGYEPFGEKDAQAELRAGQRAGARLVFRGADDYSALLALVPDAPPVLWALGDPALASRPMVSLVGARNASSLGQRMARRLAEDLGAAGHVVVSGLARGIDTAAHRASLATGTIAVMAGGIDVIYPHENAGLATEIGAKGLLLSEQPPGLDPQARHFPLRNRIISGLSRAVVVVEAALQSGSLITARIALDQGREVMAVPGHPFDARASGCNALIRDGALLVRGAEDVLAALAAPSTGRPPAPEAQAAEPSHEPTSPPPICSEGGTEVHDLILNQLGPSPLAEDQLIRDLALPAARIAPEILALELDGRIVRQAGGLLSRAS